jgi:hypothetical protein
LYTHSCRIPIIGNLIVFEREPSRHGGVVKHSVVVVLRVVEVVTQVVFEGDGGRRAGVAVRAVFVIDTLRIALVDVGVVPEGEGGVFRHDVCGFRVVGACGWEAFV